MWELYVSFFECYKTLSQSLFAVLYSWNYQQTKIIELTLKIFLIY
ncbi:hypothetical protein Pan153_32970 [Gimesia panareensis]|uniref:Uncharacterized protein n=1 Tax=Gimesia panareensis TaxID=2527978 RepID=A0A518FQK6_9PLAN|nr:hypothetical protein Pan153_32970 [Gimesia panareensis]